MKPWQWAIITAEAMLLFSVLGALAWMLLLNPAVPLAPPQLIAQAPTASLTPVPTETSTPVLVASFTPLPSRTPQPTSTRVISHEKLNQETIDQIERQVASLRGITPRATVQTEFITRDQMMEYIRKSYESNRDAANHEIALYRALGLILFGVQVDPEAMVKRMASNIAGFYDPQSKHLYVVGDLENMGTDEKATLAHEYTHALQDQRFDLAKFSSRTLRGTTDMRLATSSVVEGDATTVMSMYLYGNTTQAELDDLAHRASFTDRTPITAMNISTRTNQVYYFPYLQGTQFIVTLWVDGRGWAQVNHAYADPPQSTSIILHPERYLTQHSTPVPIPLPDLGPALGREWTATIKRDTLGEFITRIHLDEFLSDEKRAAQAADGWIGDSFSLWQAPNDRQAFAWSSAWDTPRDADEFFDACSNLLRRRIGPGLRIEREDADVRWYSGRAGSGLIRRIRANDRTLVLWGPDKATVERLLAVFK